MGFAGGDENLYRYVGNGPQRASDPAGLRERSQLAAALNLAAKFDPRFKGIQQAIAAAESTIDETCIVWENTEYMSTGGRIYTTAGTTADLWLGNVFDFEGRCIDDWKTFRGRHRLIVRGSKNVSYRQCVECGRYVFFAMGNR